MLDLNEANFHQKFTGNWVASADFTRHRTGNLLHRNLVQVLKYHARKKMRSIQNSTEGSIRDSRSESSPIRREQRFTLRGLDESVIRQKDGEFFFELKQIRKRNDVASQTVKPSERPSKRAKRNEIRCQCDITIFDNRTKGEPVIARRSTPCAVTLLNDDENPPVLGIQMEPITFKVSDLRVAVKENGSSKFKMEVVKSYFLQTSIFSLDSDDPSWPPIPIHRESDSFTPSIVQLLSKWVSLPKLPGEDNLLPIEILIKPINGPPDKDPFPTKYGLQVSAGWVKSRSPLEEYNERNWEASRRNKPSPNYDLELTSRRPEEKRPTESQVFIEWVFNASTSFAKRWIMKNLSCPLCFRDLKEWDSLKIHLKQLHLNFVFDVEDANGRSEDIAKVIKVDIVDGYPERAAKDAQTFTWQAPPDPFDIESDPVAQGWKLNTTVAKKAPESSRGRAAIKQALPLSGSSAAPKVPQPPKLRPNDVHPNGPEPAPISQPLCSKPRRYAVPAAPPRITFFRSRGKRPLKEGELLSESDDDVDTSWLDQKHAATLDTLANLTISEKQFLKVYDSHMLAEKLSSTVYLPGAVLRFVEANKALFQRPEIVSEFLKKITKLEIDGLINQDFLMRCFQLVQNLKAADKGKSRAEDPMEIDENGNKAEQHQGHCTACSKCKENIKIRRDGIVCANKICLSYLHLKCAGLERKELGWTCEDCASNTDRWS